MIGYNLLLYSDHIDGISDWWWLGIGYKVRVGMVAFPLEPAVCNSQTGYCYCCCRAFGCVTRGLCNSLKLACDACASQTSSFFTLFYISIMASTAVEATQVNGRLWTLTIESGHWFLCTNKLISTVSLLLWLIYRRLWMAMLVSILSPSRSKRSFSNVASSSTLWLLVMSFILISTYGSS